MAAAYRSGVAPIRMSCVQMRLGALRYCLTSKKKYQEVTVSVGHVDGSAMVDCTYNFYVDGELVKTVTIKADALPVTLEIPLNYGQQLKIENPDTIAYTEFGFFNGQFSG